MKGELRQPFRPRYAIAYGLLGTVIVLFLLSLVAGLPAWPGFAVYAASLLAWANVKHWERRGATELDVQFGRMVVSLVGAAIAGALAVLVFPD